MHQVAQASDILHALLFNSDNRGSKFLRNVGELSSDMTAHLSLQNPLFVLFNDALRTIDNTAPNNEVING
jgi:hypothetical protein